MPARSEQLSHPLLTCSPYQAYVYSYPHKSAYRDFPVPVSLKQSWTDEPHGSLFLYVHIPFCEMRCGFCNLFTQANPTADLTEQFLDTLSIEANAIRELVPDATFARAALGGGTPTYLSVAQLERLFRLLQSTFGWNPTQTPSAIEVSPETLTPEKLSLLKTWHFERISIGVQSFEDAETRNCGRPQSAATLNRALDMIASAGFPSWNLDLIYGLENQTFASWERSLARAVAYQPTEIFLYPLYVRPLTALGRSHKAWDDDRLALYRFGREFLLTRGYVQDSMRLFRRTATLVRPEPEYSTQTDGMIGLGCGARSYTRTLHYSHDYAVTPKGVKSILAKYLTKSASEFQHAVHGVTLNDEEQRRRFVLQGILHHAGLNREAYHPRFGTEPQDDFPCLNTVIELGLLTGDFAPSALGLERSDALGPAFFSDNVNRLMAEYQPR